MLCERTAFACIEVNKCAFMCDCRGKYAIENTAEYVLVFFIEDKH